MRLTKDTLIEGQIIKKGVEIKIKESRYRNLPAPNETIAPSIYTDFILGVKFDIHEVVKEAYSYLDMSISRFFLTIEDEFIYGFKGVNNYYRATGEERWGLFCRTRKECESLIQRYETYCKTAESLYKRFIKMNENPQARKDLEKQLNRLSDEFFVLPSKDWVV